MKKSSKIILTAILLLAAVFFSLGIFVPSLNFENRITVNKPVAQSFKIFNSPFALSEWIPGLKNVKWISGRQNEAGSKWEMIIEQDGNTYVMREELVTFKENEVFAVKMENDEMTNVMEVRFTDKGTVTEITSTNHVIGKNIFQKSLLVLSKSIFIKREKKMYEQLKKIIESSN
ncbi:MAG: SRPBCC family protein [Bacteroidetes bacterium]|nr:SRPBCC family protein [Bacteroidota bacterium]